MKKARIWTFTSIIILIISACSEGSVFLPEFDDQDINYNILESGTILSPGEEIDFELVLNGSYSQNPPDTLIIEIQNYDQNVIGTIQKDSSEIFDGSVIEFSLPSLENGFYYLHLSFIASEELVKEEQIPFFIDSGTYSIKGISDLPLNPVQNGLFLVSVQYEYPATSNPYSRWTIGEELIWEGALENPNLSLMVVLPQEPGVQTLTVELFPFEPLLEEGFSFSSSIKKESEVFIADINEIPSKYTDTPDSLLLMAMGFEGTLDPYGLGYSVQTEGSPQFVVHDGAYGYQFKIGDELIISKDEDFSLDFDPQYLLMDFSFYIPRSDEISSDTEESTTEAEVEPKYLDFASVKLSEDLDVNLSIEKNSNLQFEVLYKGQNYLGSTLPIELSNEEMSKLNFKLGFSPLEEHFIALVNNVPFLNIEFSDIKNLVFSDIRLSPLQFNIIGNDLEIIYDEFTASLHGGNLESSNAFPGQETQVLIPLYGLTSLDLDSEASHIIQGLIIDNSNFSLLVKTGSATDDFILFALDRSGERIHQFNLSSDARSNSFVSEIPSSIKNRIVGLEILNQSNQSINIMQLSLEPITEDFLNDLLGSN